MKFFVSLLSISLLSFTTPERAINKINALNVAPPSDSLSLKNFRIPSKSVNADNLDKKVVSGKTVNGFATYYASYFEGRKAANGEVFSHSKDNVASNHFKLNAWVRVTNLKNGKSIIAKVTDRMHPRMAAKGRVVDMTSRHAKTLGILAHGVAKVKVEEVPEGTKE